MTAFGKAELVSDKWIKKLRAVMHIKQRFYSCGHKREYRAGFCAKLKSRFLINGSIWMMKDLKRIFKCNYTSAGYQQLADDPNLFYCPVFSCCQKAAERQSWTSWGTALHTKTHRKNSETATWNKTLKVKTSKDILTMETCLGTCDVQNIWFLTYSTLKMYPYNVYFFKFCPTTACILLGFTFID